MTLKKTVERTINKRHNTTGCMFTCVPRCKSSPRVCPLYPVLLRHFIATGLSYCEERTSFWQGIRSYGCWTAALAVQKAFFSPLFHKVLVMINSTSLYAVINWIFAYFSCLLAVFLWVCVLVVWVFKNAWKAMCHSKITPGHVVLCGCSLVVTPLIRLPVFFLFSSGNLKALLYLFLALALVV